MPSIALSRCELPSASRVEYRLTPLGRGLAERVDGLVQWIEKNLHQVVRAREAGERVPRSRVRSRAAS